MRKRYSSAEPGRRTEDRTASPMPAQGTPFRVAALLTLFSLLGLPSFAASKKTTTLTLTALAYRVIPHETTIQYHMAGRSDTHCYGSGTYFGYAANVTVDCSTVTIPPESRSTTIRMIEVFNQLEANGMVYTVRCSAHWVGSNCSWLIPGDQFSAQMQGTTMWVDARKGGNMGKEIRPKFQVLDIRAKPVSALAKAVKAGAVLDNGGIIELIKRGSNEDNILATINARPGSYALYPDALSVLKGAGVSQSVIVAMSVNNDSPRQSETPPAPVVSAPPPAPSAVPEPPHVAVVDMSAEEVFRRFASTVLFVTCETSSTERWVGSGVLVTADGFFVTNAHVAEKCQKTTATYVKGNLQLSFDARLRYYDARTDIAVLKIDARGLDHFSLKETPLRIGQRVYAIGNPKELVQTISEGIVSGQRLDDGVTWLQHSAPISGGSSGGALIGASGELLGVNSFHLPDSQNLNFAVPLSTVIRAVNTAVAK